MSAKEKLETNSKWLFLSADDANEIRAEFEKMEQIIVGQRKHIAEQDAAMAFTEAQLRGLTDQILQWEQFHPRAAKLLRKQKNFIVIADDEPYFIRAYGMIRKREYEKGTWTAEDEQLFKQAWEKRSSELA